MMTNDFILANNVVGEMKTLGFFIANPQNICPKILKPYGQVELL